MTLPRFRIRTLMVLVVASSLASIFQLAMAGQTSVPGFLFSVLFFTCLFYYLGLNCAAAWDLVKESNVATGRPADPPQANQSAPE